MAATRSSAPVGSAQWLVSESKQADQLVRQEVEEFMFSEAQHEMEWLNAHLTDIFDQSRLFVHTPSIAIHLMLNLYPRNVRDVFKTPGKLRGKTPRTARKQQPLQNRAVCHEIQHYDRLLVLTIFFSLLLISLLQMFSLLTTCL